MNNRDTLGAIGILKSSVSPFQMQNLNIDGQEESPYPMDSVMGSS
jgi:hypothetical protein